LRAGLAAAQAAQWADPQPTGVIATRALLPPAPPPPSGAVVHARAAGAPSQAPVVSVSASASAQQPGCVGGSSGGIEALLAANASGLDLGMGGGRGGWALPQKPAAMQPKQAGGAAARGASMRNGG
jgi:hypothetical protein